MLARTHGISKCMHSHWTLLELTAPEANPASQAQQPAGCGSTQMHARMALACACIATTTLQSMVWLVGLMYIVCMLSLVCLPVVAHPGISTACCTMHLLQCMLHIPGCRLAGDALPGHANTRTGSVFPPAAAAVCLHDDVRVVHHHVGGLEGGHGADWWWVGGPWRGRGQREDGGGG